MCSWRQCVRGSYQTWPLDSLSHWRTSWPSVMSSSSWPRRTAWTLPAPCSSSPLLKLVINDRLKANVRMGIYIIIHLYTYVSRKCFNKNWCHYFISPRVTTLYNYNLCILCTSVTPSRRRKSLFLEIVMVMLLNCVVADEVHQVVVQGNKLIKTKVPALRQSLALYLANEETEHILFRPVKVLIPLYKC